MTKDVITKAHTRASISSGVRRGGDAIIFSPVIQVVQGMWQLQSKLVACILDYSSSLGLGMDI